ncbi:MAG: hypothetical protein KDA25_05405 [Phycisphaerales bacterium]|nr:hypothetical protein [Phycisphaerales bacterium]
MMRSLLASMVPPGPPPNFPPESGTISGPATEIMFLVIAGAFTLVVVTVFVIVLMRRNRSS